MGDPEGLNEYDGTSSDLSIFTLRWENMSQQLPKRVVNMVLCLWDVLRYSRPGTLRGSGKENGQGFRVEPRKVCEVTRGPFENGTEDGVRRGGK